MIKTDPLFCPHCNAPLVVYNAPRVHSKCPACGTVIHRQQRVLQNLLFTDTIEIANGLAAQAGLVWLWGSQGDQAHLLHLNPASLKIQEVHPVPNNWQVNGLAVTEKLLVCSPGELNPPGNPKALVGIRQDTGKVLWEYSTPGFMLTSPAADEHLACAVDSNGTLIAVNPLSGKAAWPAFQQLVDYPHRGIPPVLSRDHVLAVGPESRDGTLMAFHRSTGDKAWEFHPPDNTQVDFAPAVWNDSAFVLAGEWLYCVSLLDGSWTRLSCSERKSSQGWYFARPVVDENHVYLLEAGYTQGKNGYSLHACDGFTGQSLWRMNLKRRPRQPPAIQGEYVYFVDRDGELFCLQRNDGKIIWQEHLSAEPAARPVAMENTILALTQDSTLHIVTLSTPSLDLSKPPAYYEKRDEWTQAAGAYLANNQPFETGLALLKAKEYRQANLAFNMVEDAGQKVQEVVRKFLLNKNDAQAAELCEDWGMILIERLGEQARGNAEVARWFDEAAHNFMLANLLLEATDCREHAAQIKETPRIKLEVIAEENTRWVVNESLLLQVLLTNMGYGPARCIHIKVSGNIRKPHPSQSFADMAVDHTYRWDHVRVIPNSVGAGLLEFTLEYESYRTGQVTQTRFTHPIHVEKNQDEAIRNAIPKGATLHIEKFFSPGATHNEIEISDSQGIAIGNQAKFIHAPGAPAEGNSKEEQMDAVTLVVSALLGGLTAGLTDTAKAATKDMYEALKARLLKKAGNNEDTQDALDKIEKKPDSKARQELLKEEVAKLHLEEDDELLKLAQSLLEALKESNAQAGKFSVDIQNSQGIVVGDNANVTQNFGVTPGEQNKAA